MSRTYPRGAESDPLAAEREQMRAITRQLHEAAQDARAAARELRAERAAAGPDIVTETKAAAQMAILAIDGHVVGRLTELREQLDVVTGLRDSFLARLAELADTELDQKGMEDFMAGAVLHAVRSPEFISRVVEVIAGEINADPSLVTSHMITLPSRAGEVLVGTPEMLAAFRRSGGDPGIVIDART